MAHWTDAVKAENAKLKAEISELRLRPELTSFANHVGNDIMAILAMLPMAEWPKVAKLAFDHSRRQAPTIAALYLERLPKKIEP